MLDDPVHATEVSINSSGWLLSFGDPTGKEKKGASLMVKRERGNGIDAIDRFHDDQTRTNVSHGPKYVVMRRIVAAGLFRSAFRQIKRGASCVPHGESPSADTKAMHSFGSTTIKFERTSPMVKVCCSKTN